MVINKEWNNTYNDFNSLKALVHVKYWDSIKDNIIPPPIFVSIDPMAACNFNCSFCNASKVIKDNMRLTNTMIDTITNTLKTWDTKAICIGGGGEPLLNNNVGYMINSIRDIGIDIGVVTNGYLLSKYEAELSRCKWVGVSIDAGNSTTYSSIKGVPSQYFTDVLDSMKRFSETKSVATLSYKYLLHPNNFSEVYTAAKLAKEVGCDYIHFRPGGDPWFDPDRNEFNFTDQMIDEVRAQLNEARKEFEDGSFKIFGILHKFTDSWEIKRSFSKCYAGFVTGVFTADGKFGICCDRRGDNSTTLCSHNKAVEVWGSKEHIDLVNEINVKHCPRCTYSHVNEIFENVIVKDNMGYYFI